MPFGFDPRKLVEEDQQEKDKETKEAIDSVLTFEEIAEKNEAFIRNKSTISDAFDGAFKALREHKFQKKYGEDAYIDEKLKEDPEYRDSRKFSDAENKQYYRDELESMRGVMKGVKYDFSTGNTIYPEEDKLTENQKKFFKKVSIQRLQVKQVKVIKKNLLNLIQKNLAQVDLYLLNQRVYRLKVK